jgi:hypothetical protein
MRPGYQAGIGGKQDDQAKDNSVPGKGNEVMVSNIVNQPTHANKGWNKCSNKSNNGG